MILFMTIAAALSCIAAFADVTSPGLFMLTASAFWFMGGVAGLVSDKSKPDVIIAFLLAIANFVIGLLYVSAV